MITSTDQGAKMPALDPQTRVPQPDDVLSAIFVLAQREEGHALRFRGHDSELQRVFNELTPEHPILAKYFVFSDSGPVPFSPALNDAISRLQLAGLIGRDNPDYQVVFLRSAAEEYFDAELAANLKPDERADISKAATAFLNKVVRQ